MLGYIDWQCFVVGSNPFSDCFDFCVFFFKVVYIVGYGKFPVRDQHGFFVFVAGIEVISKIVCESDIVVIFKYFIVENDFMLIYKVYIYFLLFCRFFIFLMWLLKHTLLA